MVTSSSAIGVEFIFGTFCSTLRRSVTSTSGLEMAWTKNLCPLSAPHQQLLSAVHTATAYAALFPDHVKPKVYPPTVITIWSPHLKRAPHNIFPWVQDLPINLAVSILPHSVYFASLVCHIVYILLH